LRCGRRCGDWLLLFAALRLCCRAARLFSRLSRLRTSIGWNGSVVLGHGLARRFTPPPPCRSHYGFSYPIVCIALIVGVVGWFCDRSRAISRARDPCNSSVSRAPREIAVGMQLIDCPLLWYMPVLSAMRNSHVPISHGTQSNHQARGHIPEMNAGPIATETFRSGSRNAIPGIVQCTLHALE